MLVTAWFRVGTFQQQFHLDLFLFGDVLLYYHGKSHLNHHLGNISGTFSKHQTSKPKFQLQDFCLEYIQPALILDQLW